MPATKLTRQTVTIHDVQVDVSDRIIESFIKKHVPNAVKKTNRGTPYSKNGVECQRIYIDFKQANHVDQLMANEPFQLNGRSVRIMRQLPQSFVLHDRCVTGLKVKILSNNGQEFSATTLNDRHLRKYFEQFGTIRSSRWVDSTHQEALFVYAQYDHVDKAILSDSSPKINGVRVNLEKTRSEHDFAQYQRPYVVHITKLPVCITSEKLSAVLQVPIANILLYPCFRCERENDREGRTSSEAWIYDFDQIETARKFAENANGKSVGSCRIECQAELEAVDVKELCEQFQVGRCPYINDCRYKHYTCNEPDTCDDKDCWLGHSIKRATQSRQRPQYRQEEAKYRVRLSNLPRDVAREELGNRLGIKSKHRNRLILQTDESENRATQTAYLIRQLLHNKLREQFGKWHNQPFSQQMPLLIQCQLELNQDYYEWNDTPEVPSASNNSQYASPAASVKSYYSTQNRRPASVASAASIRSCQSMVPRAARPVLSTQLSRHESAPKSNASKKGGTAHLLRAESVAHIRAAPADMLPLLEEKWTWASLMIPKNKETQDEYYWLDEHGKREGYALVKIYSSLPDGRTADIRAQCEQAALTRLSKLDYFPQLVHTNCNPDRPNRECWSIMKPMVGQRLSSYVRGLECDLADALRISQQILRIVQQMHDLHVIHRDIQPEHILVRKSNAKPKELHFMLINFHASWVDDMSTATIDGFKGNDFYKMPQFETEEQSEGMLNARYSPTIDATGVCAVLFWMITGKQPKESRDINDRAPHQLPENVKIIERKIKDLTALREESRTPAKARQQLAAIFDRCFAGPKRQMTVAELDSQLQSVIQLVMSHNQ